MKLGWLFKCAAILLFLYGAALWLDLSEASSGIYLRRSLQLPLMMAMATAVVVFSGFFQGRVKGLAFYLELIGLAALIIFIVVVRGMHQQLGI